MKVATSLVLLLSVSVFAKDKPKITIQVVDSQYVERRMTQLTGGTDMHSARSCASTVSGLNCDTTMSPGTAGTASHYTIVEEHVRVIMPDGLHATLLCQNAYSHCEHLSPGTFEADVSGNTLRIYVHQLNGKDRTIKYSSVKHGGW